MIGLKYIFFNLKIIAKDFRKQFLAAYFNYPSIHQTKKVMQVEPVLVAPTCVYSISLPGLPIDIWRNILLFVNDETDGLYTLNKAKTVCKQFHQILHRGTNHCFCAYNPNKIHFGGKNFNTIMGLIILSQITLTVFSILFRGKKNCLLKIMFTINQNM